MARLVGGIGIYLTVLLLLYFASPSMAAERLPDDTAGTAIRGTAQQPAMSLFDLSSLRIRQHEMRSGRSFSPSGAGVPPVDGSGAMIVQGAAGRHFRGPSLSYHVGRRGPVIELGMLGGTLKPKQRLAHLALNWDF